MAASLAVSSDVAIAQNLDAQVALSSPTRGSTNRSLTRKGFEELRDFQCDKAIACFSRALAINQTDLSTKQGQRKVAQLLALIGVGFRFDENELAAAQALRFATTLDPDNKVYRAILAECLYRCDRLQESREIIDGLHPNPDDSLIVHTVSTIKFIRQLDLQPAARMLSDALSTTHDTINLVRGYYLLARIYAKQGFTGKAAHYFKLAADHALSPYMATVYRGLSLQARLNAEAASKCFQEAGKLNPDDPSWLNSLADCCTKVNTDQERLRLRERAVGCKRYSTLALAGLASLLNDKGDLKTALACADYEQKMRPWSADGYALRARLLRCDRGAEVMLVDNFNTAIAKQPDNAGLYAQFAQHFVDRGDYGYATRIYLEGVKRCPHAENLWSGLAMLSTKMRKWEDAKLYSEHALECVPPNVDELNVLAQSEFARMHAVVGTSEYKGQNLVTNFEHAKAFNRYKFSPKLPALLTCMQMRPGRIDFSQNGINPVAMKHTAIADMLMETRQLPDAIKEFELALAADPESVDIHTYLLNALSENNQWFRAAQEDWNLSNKLLLRIPTKVAEIKKQFDRTPEPARANSE